MKVICITGSCGAGKSYISDIIKNEFGIKVIDSDKVSRMLMEPGQTVYKEVVRAFGEDILKADKTINRPKLADIVFNDDKKLRVLNAIVHPLTIEEINSQIANAYELGDNHIFVESAIAIKSGYVNFCDEMWFIDAPAEERSIRLKNSRGYSDEKIASIMNSQKETEATKDMCDVIINNSSSKTKEELTKEIEKYLQ